MWGKVESMSHTSLEDYATNAVYGRYFPGCKRRDKQRAKDALKDIKQMSLREFGVVAKDQQKLGDYNGK